MVRVSKSEVKENSKDDWDAKSWRILAWKSRRQMGNSSPVRTTAQERWDRLLAGFLGRDDRLTLEASAPSGIGSNITESGTLKAFASFKMLRIDGLRLPRSMPAKYVRLIHACLDRSS
jgi:hypothetical protein